MRPSRRVRPFQLLVATLAAYRWTRLVVADSLLDGWRTRWFRRFPPTGTPPRRGHPLGQLVDCPWCIGFWIAGLVVTVAAMVHVLPWRPSTWWLAWPAASVGVGLLARVDSP